MWVGWCFLNAHFSSSYLKTWASWHTVLFWKTIVQLVKKFSSVDRTVLHCSWLCTIRPFPYPLGFIPKLHVFCHEDRFNSSLLAVCNYSKWYFSFWYLQLKLCIIFFIFMYNMVVYLLPHCLWYIHTHTCILKIQFTREFMKLRSWSSGMWLHVVS